MGKLFGSDGIYGVVNADITCELVYRLGQALAKVLEDENGRKAKVYIGKDTRISSDMLECSMAAGLSSAGARVGLLGYIPTPAVAYIAEKHGADASVVISASSNPVEFNAIKILDSKGTKLSEVFEKRLEKLVSSKKGIELSVGMDIGRIYRFDDAAKEYSEHIKNTVLGDLSGMRILVDCANGSTYRCAPMILEGLDAEFDIINASPDGKNINSDCGTSRLEKLRSAVAAGKYDVGIAFDGDGVLCLATDEKGDVIDGNRITALCAKSLNARGKLPHKTFVIASESNLGIYAYAKENGIFAEGVDIKKNTISEFMSENGYALGGEVSGHVIFKEFSKESDGELTAVQFLSALKEFGKKTSEALSEVRNYPQIKINVKVPDDLKEDVLDAWHTKKALHKAEEKLGEDGRVYILVSESEPVLSVVAEGKNSRDVSSVAGEIADAIAKVVKLKK
ncbi:MAG: phosphoglucosamine mutase [Oscillospiraceae bacterium]|nr:phosphoglucosamine mutase [Oscillospiraceae bacterium]